MHDLLAYILPPWLNTRLSWQALSKALTELRSDMVTQAQAQVRAHTEHGEQEVNVQAIVNKHTRELGVGFMTILNVS